MAVRFVPPSVSATAFNCPHCSAYTTQYWYRLGATQLDKNEAPRLHTRESVDAVIAGYKKDMKEAGHTVDPDKLVSFAQKMAVAVAGFPYLDSDSEHFQRHLGNLHLTKCYACGDIAIWRYDSLLWPVGSEAPDANVDLPADVALDYREAGAILPVSSRGSAALLRLAIEKLCKDLLGDASTGDLNKDIAALVTRGLDKRVEMALDIVRVIGNEAVHPGTLDLRDSRATAEELFRLVNLIAEIMITQPKHIAEMYQAIPEKKREGIEQRNAKAIASPKKAE